MEVFQLASYIDGFTGASFPIRYFRSFKQAEECVENIPGIYRLNGEWFIEGMKDVNIENSEEIPLNIHGVPFTGKEFDPMRHCGAGWVQVTKMEIGTCDTDKVYELHLMDGFSTHLNKMHDVIDYDMDSVYSRMYPHHIEFDRILGISGSRKRIRKLARIEFKKYARGWNNKEYDERCSVLNGAWKISSPSEFTNWKEK